MTENPCGRNYKSQGNITLEECVPYNNSEGADCNEVFGFTSQDVQNGAQTTIDYLYNDSLPPGINNCTAGEQLIGRSWHRNCRIISWPTNNIIPCCSFEMNSVVECDPSWCPGSVTCSNALQTFCTQGGGENITSKECQSICSNPPNDSTKTWCDIASVEYCQQPSNNNVPYCGCINSKNGTRLACFDPNCTTLGYRTRTVTQDLITCSSGDVTICNQAINCNESGTCNIDQNKFDSICATSSSNSSPGLIVHLLIWIIIILIIIILIFAFIKK